MVTSSAAAEQVIARHHDDRRLGVQRHRVEHLLVDRQPEQAGVGIGGSSSAAASAASAGTTPEVDRPAAARPTGGLHLSTVTPGTTTRQRNLTSAGQRLSARTRARAPGRTGDPMSKPKKSQVMKPATAALKLDVYLPATPQEFQEGWCPARSSTNCSAIRRSGSSTCAATVPIPATSSRPGCGCRTAGSPVAASPTPLTTAQIAALVADPPEWLIRERETHAETRREQQRLRERRN